MNKGKKAIDWNRECKRCKKNFFNKTHTPGKVYCTKECQLEGTKKYYQELRTLRKSLGRCVYCDNDLDNTLFNACLNCRLRARESSKLWRAKNGRRNTL